MSKASDAILAKKHERRQELVNGVIERISGDTRFHYFGVKMIEVTYEEHKAILMSGLPYRNFFMGYHLMPRAGKCTT